MSVKALTWAFGCPISGNEKVVLLALADHADDDGVCWPSIRRIAEKGYISERSVQRILPKLVELGFVHMQDQISASGRTTARKYTLRVDESSKSLSEGDKLSGGDTVVTGEGDTVVTLYNEPSERTINNKPPISPLLEEEFEKFWAAYPQRPGNPRSKAFESYKKARTKKPVASHEEIMRGVNAYAKTRHGKDTQYTAQAVTWLNQRRWEDEYDVPTKRMYGRNFV